ncbi:MAG: Xaa-Pro peptidase family protein [Eubacteriales bacterium]
MDKLNKLLTEMKQNHIDALYVTKEANVKYLSGYPDELAYLFICKDTKYIITDTRFIEEAEKSCPDYEVINWHSHARSIPKTLVSLCEKHQVKNLGFEKNFTTYDKYEALSTLTADTEITLTPTENLIENLRYQKNEGEIANLRIACEIADKALYELIPHIKVGVTERELCAHLEFSMKMHGAQDLGFETILISGAKSSLLHGKPSDKKIEYGDYVLVDFGAKYNGYISDMTRTFIVGKASEKQKEIYELVKVGQQIGLDNMGPNIHTTTPDTEIRKIMGDYEEYYYCGIGHGVGLDLHEEPFIGNYGTRTMETGCVITMEPGIYIPGWGGVRIEDTVLITDDGVELLTHFPKELMIL